MNDFTASFKLPTMNDFVDNFVSDATEAYCVGRTTNNKLFVYPIRRILFDRNISCSEELTITGNFEMSAICNEQVFTDCKELLTEYKQNKEYEETIAKLTKKIDKLHKENLSLKSAILQYQHDKTPLEQACQMLESNTDDYMFALFVDDYSKANETTIINVPLIRNDKFFTSDYWTELLSKNERYKDEEVYSVNHNTYDGYGYNAWFFVCDMKSVNDCIHRLLMYPTDLYNVILGDENYMYETLDNIWKVVFGKEHSEENCNETD